MSNKQRYDVDIHFNSNISTIKEMTTEANKLRTVIAKMEAEGVKSVAQKNQLDGYKKQEAAISRVLKKVKEQTSHMIRGSVEYNESVEKSLRTFNANTAKAVKVQEKLNAAVREQVQLEEKLARASNKAANEEKKKSLWSRTKKALGQSFLEAPLYAASFAIMNQASQSLQTYIEIDKTLTRIGIVTGRSAESMKQFAVYAEEAGRALGVTGKTFAEASLTFLQQGGLAADYANSLAESSIKLANITGKSSSDTSEYITAIANSFKLLESEGSSAGGHIADMLASLDAASGSSADEIAQAFERSASSFASAGFSAEQASAMIATVSETTRQSAEMVGTGFKTMIGNLADVAAGKGTDEITSKLQKVAQDFGLSYSMIDKNTGNMKQVPQILREVADLYNNTNDLAAKNALVEAVAGKEQRDRFIALITNQERYNELLGNAQNSAGAADEANRRYMDSAAAKIEVIKNEWEALTMKIVNSDTFKWFLDEVAALISSINASITGFGDALWKFSKVAIPLTLAMKSSKTRERFGDTALFKWAYNGKANPGEEFRTEVEKAAEETRLAASQVNESSRKNAITVGQILVGAAKEAGLALVNKGKSMPGSSKWDTLQGSGVEGLGRETTKSGRPKGFLNAIRYSSPFQETTIAGEGKFFKGLATRSGVAGAGKALVRGAVNGGLFAAATGAMDIVSHLKSTENTANKVRNVIGDTAVIAGSFFGPLGMAAGYAVKFGLSLANVSTNAEQLRNELEKNKATFKEAFTSNPGSVKDLVEKINILPQGTEEYISAANELAKIAPQLTLGQDEFGNAILDSTNAINDYVTAIEKEIKADERAANKKAARKARSKSEAAETMYYTAKSQTDKNTYAGALSKSVKDELYAVASNLNISDEEKKYLKSGIAKSINSENVIDYFGKLKTDGVKEFFRDNQELFIEEGRKGFDAQYAVNEIINGGKIDWAKNTFTSFVEQISRYSGLTAQQLARGNFLKPIIDSLVENFNDLDKNTRGIRFDELAANIIPDSKIFDASQFKSVVINAKNSAGALAEASSILIEAGRINGVITESLNDDGIIDSDEFIAITRMLSSSKNFKLTYGKLSGKKAYKKVKSTGDYSKIGMTAEKNAYDLIKGAGNRDGYGPGSDKKPEQEMQDFIKDALDKLAYSRAVREGIVADEQAKLDAMSASDAGYIKQEESVANAKKAIVAQAEAERDAIIQVGKSHPTLIKTAAYQEALNKANQDVAKSYKDVKESLQKLALDKAYQTVFGTADLEGYKERYKIKQELLDISLDSYEQIVEKATLELEIQKEIDSATNEVYKSNLRILESKVKTTKLNKAIIDGLQGQLKLMKALNSENDSQLKLTRTSNGSFRYLNTGFDNSQKEQALAVSRQNEAESIQKYREQSAKITDLEAQILQYSSSTDPEKKSKVPMLQKTLDYLKKMVFGDDGYAQQIQKNKVLTALIEEGRMDIARDLNSGKITSDKALSYLPKKIADAIKQSYRSEVDAGSATGNAALIDSNGNIVNTNTILNKSTNNLNTAMKNLQSEMAKIQNLKIDPSSIAGIADAVGKAIADNIGDGTTKIDTTSNPTGTGSKNLTVAGAISKGMSVGNQVREILGESATKQSVQDVQEAYKGLTEKKLVSKYAGGKYKSLGKKGETTAELYKRLKKGDPYALAAFLESKGQKGLADQLRSGKITGEQAMAKIPKKLKEGAKKAFFKLTKTQKDFIKDYERDKKAEDLAIVKKLAAAIYQMDKSRDKLKPKEKAAIKELINFDKEWLPTYGTIEKMNQQRPDLQKKRAKILSKLKEISGALDDILGPKDVVNKNASQLDFVKRFIAEGKDSPSRSNREQGTLRTLAKEYNKRLSPYIVDNNGNGKKDGLRINDVPNPFTGKYKDIWKLLDLEKFDTGGYTGDFNGGKVAMLHEKELVLNKLDTENMLKAVQIVREIPQLAAAIPNMSSSTTSSNQNVTINANFPNATSSDEIKKALESLSSKALQYQYRTKSY